MSLLWFYDFSVQSVGPVMQSLHQEKECGRNGVLLHEFLCAVKTLSCQSAAAEIYLVKRTAELWEVEVVGLALGWSWRELSSGGEHQEVCGNPSSGAAGGRELPCKC